MSRIAVIADIHANVPALEAVLADIEQLQVDEVLVNGDLVGRGPLGSRVVERIGELGLRSTRGNHEDYHLQFRRGEVPEEWLTSPEWSCARWMAAELGADHAEYIDALPFTLTSELEPQLRLFHGSPRSHSEGIGGWTGDEALREHLASIDEAVLVVAHTHRPLQRHIDDRLVVNVGSVGMPFNGDARAQYVVFEGSGTDFEVAFRQVDYDRGEIYRLYEETGFLEAGNATAHLLRVEIETARPHLVPFLQWSKANETPATIDHLDDFLAVFDPNTSMADFARTIGLE